jgi:hypothetical protein
LELHKDAHDIAKEELQNQINRLELQLEQANDKIRVRFFNSNRPASLDDLTHFLRSRGYKG